MTDRGLKSGGIELPLALLALAFVVSLVFQTVQLVRDSESLATIDRNQDAPLQDTMRLRQTTDGLVTDLLHLAQNGNASAKQVVAEMAKQNVVLREKPPADSPKATQ